MPGTTRKSLSAPIANGRVDRFHVRVSCDRRHPRRAPCIEGDAWFEVTPRSAVRCIRHRPIDGRSARPTARAPARRASTSATPDLAIGDTWRSRPGQDDLPSESDPYAAWSLARASSGQAREVHPIPTCTPGRPPRVLLVIDVERSGPDQDDRRETHAQRETEPHHGEGLPVRSSDRLSEVAVMTGLSILAAVPGGPSRLWSGWNARACASVTERSSDGASRHQHDATVRLLADRLRCDSRMIAERHVDPARSSADIGSSWASCPSPRHAQRHVGELAQLAFAPARSPRRRRGHVSSTHLLVEHQLTRCWRAERRSPFRPINAPSASFSSPSATR